VIRVRAYTAPDARALHDVFSRAVLDGAARAYTLPERRAWRGPARMPRDWPARLGGQVTFVGTWQGALAGFMTRGHDGHLDFAYVAPEAQGTGLATAIHDRLVEDAAARDVSILTTEASLAACRFFRRQGWREIGENRVVRRGVVLRNVRMEKRLMP